MKCDELQAIESATAVIENVHLVYRKSEVDAAIDELKREHHRERHEYIDMVAQHKAKLVEQESENRKLIADLEESHKKEVRQLLILNREQANAANRLRDNMEQALRRQKKKRCLAMAEMCDARHDEEDTKVNGHGASWEYKSKEMKYWERWHNRWLAIAEKFKPN